MLSVLEDKNKIAGLDWNQIDLYRFFALVFAPPSYECFDFLSQPSAVVALQQLWRRLRCEGDFPEFEWFTTYELYESAYIALFDVGVPEPPVPLFESAHDKSHPAQEIVLENTHFYEVVGLRSDSSRAVPDYLITQLEFLAALRFLIDNSPDEATVVALARAKREFLERHLLNWIPTAKTKLNRIAAPTFPVLAFMLLQFLESEHQGLVAATLQQSQAGE